MSEMEIEEAGVGDVKSPMVVGLCVDCADRSRVEIIREWIEEMGKVWVSCFPLTISLDVCGGQVTYRTVGDIPLIDVPCPCGNPNHWLIKYQEAS